MGFAIAGALNFTTQGFWYYATAIVINLAIASILGKVLAPDFSDARDNQGMKKVIRSNIMPRRIIYGEALVGGPYVTLMTRGDDNENLEFIVALAGHPVEDIIGFIMEDEYIDISGGTAGSPSGGTGNNLSTDYYVTPNPLGNTNSGNDNYRLIRIIKNTGWGYADNQYVNDKTDAVTNPHANPVIDRTRAAEIATSMGNWSLPGDTTRNADGLYTTPSIVGDADKLTNVPHIYIKVRHEPDILTGWPTPEFHVKGKRLYNPSKDSTLSSVGGSGTHRIDDPDTWEWSEDWTLCALDFLISAAYGIGARFDTDPNNWGDITLNEINWADMIQSYSESSEVITNGPAPGEDDHGTGARYTMNGVFETSSTPISIMESILTAGGGELIYSQGLYSLRPGVYRAPVDDNAIINEEMIVGNLTIQTHTPRTDLFNKAAGVFVSKAYDENSSPYTKINKPLFVSTDFPIVDPKDGEGENPYEIADGEEIIQDFDYPFTIRSYEAQRLARIQLERVRRGMVISFEANLEVLKYSVGDNIYLQILSDSKYAGLVFYNRLGLDDDVQPNPDPPPTTWYKQFRIINMEYTENFTVNIILLEESEDIYDWNEGDASPEANSLISDLIIEEPLGIVQPPSFIVDSPDQTITEVATVMGDLTQIRWTAPDRGSLVTQVDRAFIDYYEMEFGIVTDPSLTSENRVAVWSPVGLFNVNDRSSLIQGPLTITNLFIDGFTDYDFRIKSVTFMGRKSQWAYYSEDIGSDYNPSSPGSLTRYYILPISGTAIKNSLGELTVEAHEITGSGDNLLDAGDTKLYVGSVEVTLDNGYVSGSDGYTGIFDADNILDSVVVELRNDTLGFIYDTITLVDITDGSVGAGATFGYVEVHDTLAWVLTDDGALDPTDTDTQLDVTFVRDGADVARIGYQIDISDSPFGFSDGGAVAHTDTNLNAGHITPTLNISPDIKSALMEFAYDDGAGNISFVSESVVAVSSGLQRHYIKAIDGTAIHNNEGFITLEARIVNDEGDNILTTGIWKLYDDVGTIIETGEGYPSPSDGYTARLGADNIDGDMIVSLRSPGGAVKDTITVVDITDGIDAVVGWVTPDFLAWRRDPNDGAWVPVGTTTDLIFTFNQSLADVARQGYRITRAGNGTLTGATFVDGSDLNIDRLTPSITGSGTTNFTIQYDYDDGAGSTSTVAETVLTVAGGMDGDDGAAGNDGAAGTDSRTVSLSSTLQVFNYLSDGNLDTSGTTAATITAIPLNTVGTPWYEFFINDVSIGASSTTDNFSYDATSEAPTFTDGPDKIEVELTEDSGSPPIYARDQMTIYGVMPGVDAPLVVQTNEAHTIPVTTGGSHDYTGSGNTIKVFIGTTQIPYDDTVTYASPSFRVSSIDDVDITVDPSPTKNSPANGIYYGEADAMGAEVASIEYTIIVRNNEGIDTTLTRVQTFARSNQGATGAQGDAGDAGNDGNDGSAGVDSRTVNLTAGQFAFEYFSDDTLNDNADTTITATALNTVGTPYYEFFLNDDSEEDSTSNTYTYTPDADWNNMPDKIEVHITEGGTGGTIYARDQITIIGVKPGIDAITGFLTNEAHTVASDNDGTNYDLSGAGGTFIAYDGVSQLDPDTDIAYAVYDGDWNQDNATQNGLTFTIVDTTGVYALTGGSWTTDTETFNVRASYNGVDIDKDYTISKSKGGASNIPNIVSIMEYDDLDTTQLAAGPSRYAMLTNRAVNTSGSQNNFHLTDGILLNEIDLAGINRAKIFADVQLGDRIVYYISAVRWFLFEVDELFSVVGDAAKLGVNLLDQRDYDPTTNISTSAGTTVQFQFQQPLAETHSLLLDPDFDLTTGTAGLQPWMDSTKDTGTASGSDVVFNSGGGADGSNSFILSTGNGTSGSWGVSAYLKTLRRVRANFGSFEFKIRYKTSATVFQFQIGATGYAGVNDSTQTTAGTYIINLPNTSGVWTTYSAICPPGFSDDARFWTFAVSIHGANFGDVGGWDEDIEIDSVFVYPASDQFGSNVESTKVISGNVPESDTSTDAGKYLKADGTWDDPPGDGGVSSVTAGVLIDNSGDAADVVIDVDLSEASGAVFAPATDFMVFLDGGASGTAAKDSWDDIAEIIAGANITNTSGVLSVADVYVHPSYTARSPNIDTGALSNAYVISDLDLNLTSDTQGHITAANMAVSTRELTAGNIGAATSGHTHETYDHSAHLSGANVFDQVNVTNGIVTGVASRALSINDLGGPYNNYSLPQATATVRGGIELFSNTDNPTAANSVSSTASRTYGIQLNAANQAVVNVPWTAGGDLGAEFIRHVTLDYDSGDIIVAASAPGGVVQGDIWFDTNATAGFMASLADDSSPTLGGTLQAGGNTIDMGTNVITDTKVGQWATAYGWGDWSGHAHAASAITAGSMVTGVNPYITAYSGNENLRMIMRNASDASGASPLYCDTGASMYYNPNTNLFVVPTIRAITVEATWSGEPAPAAGTSVLSGNFLHIDGKEAIDGNDTWLRLNQNSEFSGGTIVTGTFRTNQALQAYGSIVGDGATTITGIETITIDSTGKLQFGDTTSYVMQNDNIRLGTDHGYVDIGPLNASYCHFNTSIAGGFYFYDKITMANDIVPITDSLYDLGSTSQYWALAYIDDLKIQSTGDIMKTSHGNYLYHASTAYDNDQNGQITFGTGIATGGTAGDIHFRYEV